MTETTFKKRRDGLVLNMDDGGLEQYRQTKKNVKALVNTRHELSDTRNEISSLKSELNEIKAMMQQLLKKN